MTEPSSVVARVAFALSLLPAVATTAFAAPTPPAPTAPVVTAAVSASDVVDRVQKFYAGIKQVTASFRQSVTNDTFGSTKTSDGKVWIAKPGKMRWDYYAAKRNKAVEVKKSFISNGKYLYVVEHDNKQVMKKNLQNDLMPVAVSFLYGTGDLKAEFTAALDPTSKYGSPGDIVLKMTPKQSSAQYKNLYLVVAPDNFRVTKSVIVDSSNNVNEFRFYEPNFETNVKDSVFEFDQRSVPSYRVIDGDAPQGAGSAATTGDVPNPPVLPAVPPAKSR